MPLLFLDAVNSTLKRAGLIAGDSGELSTATGSSNYTASTIFTQRSDLQHSIDLVVEMWQETANEVYINQLTPSLLATATIVLATDTREYALPDDFERVAGSTPEERVMRAATETFTLGEYPGGYLKMLADQPVATMWTGEPQAYAISPRNGALRIDRHPTSDENGETFNLAYERRIDLTATMATATMPFSDSVVRSLIPVVAEFYGRVKNRDFDQAIFRASLIRAFQYANKTPPMTRYGVRRA